MINYSKYTNIIFDFDGVIANSNNIKKTAIQNASIKYLSKKDHKIFIQYFTNNNGMPREDKISTFFKGNEYYSVLNTYNQILNKELKKVNLTKGTIQYLEFLYLKGINLYILSGGDEREIFSISIDKNFKHYFCEIKGAPKTKEDNLLNMNIEGKTLYFGDSKKDYDIALENNFDFIFMYGYTQFYDWENFFKDKRILLKIRDFKALLKKN